jgi:hypothetical protein
MDFERSYRPPLFSFSFYLYSKLNSPHSLFCRTANVAIPLARRACPFADPKDPGAHYLHGLHARDAPREELPVAQDKPLAHLIIR